MSKIGNYRVGIQESCNYQLGWESAERGEPSPDWCHPDSPDADHLAQRRLGWIDWHAENWQFGAGA